MAVCNQCEDGYDEYGRPCSYCRGNSFLKDDDDCGFDEEIEFHRCSGCDGHDACEDFGCAIDAGIIVPDPFPF